MVAAFDINDVNANPARFDLKKAEAINADHIRMLDPRTSGPAGALPAARRRAAAEPSGDASSTMLAADRRRWCRRGSGAVRSPAMVGFLFYLADDALPVADDARAS